MLAWDSIENGFEKFLEILARDKRVQVEFERSRADFFSEPHQAQAPGAERRHLEWFLLERPCQTLGTIPALAWQDEWRAGLDDAPDELAAGFLHSLPGAFEVTSVVPAEGLWLRDLFTMGEHPVAEASATREIAVGDLLVGRLFPGGGGVFLLSPAVSVFRNATLLAAVRIDLAKMRSVRRGVLRVQQLELEHLFRGPGIRGGEAPDPSEVRARARAALLDLGLEPRTAADVLERVRRAAGAAADSEVTEILNTLAFDTGIDLSSARLVLVELWEHERGPWNPVPLRSNGTPPSAGGTEVPEVSTALEAFDRGRAQGKELEQLFLELERELGIADDEQDGDETSLGAPDFPGVIGALVDEFLWEVEREQGPDSAGRWQVLKRLGHYAQDIGVFEELEEVRLLDFSARWLLDECNLKEEAEVSAVLDALMEFCRWCEEQHDLPLHMRFGPTLSLLIESVPRHFRLRRLVRLGPGLGAHRVIHVAENEARVRDRAGNEQVVPLTPPQAAELRDGDLVRLVGEGARLALGHAYPAELAATLF